MPDLKPIGSYVSYLDAFVIWPQLTCYSLLTIDMVDIYVGAKRKTFRLHENLLCDCSEYFKATFKGEFTEAKSQETLSPRGQRRFI